MRRLLVVVSALCLFLSLPMAVCASEDISDFVLPGETSTLVPASSGQDTVGPMMTLDAICKKMNISFNSLQIVDPHAISSQPGKYEKMNECNAIVYSIRRRKTKDGEAFDLMTDFCWKKDGHMGGYFTDKVKNRDGNLWITSEKPGCGNKVVLVIADLHMTFEFTSTFIRQVQEICKYVKAVSPPCPVSQPEVCIPDYRKPSLPMIATVAHVEYRYLPGVLQILLGAVWHPGAGTRINNNNSQEQRQTAKGGQGGDAINNNSNANTIVDTNNNVINTGGGKAEGYASGVGHSDADSGNIN